MKPRFPQPGYNSNGLKNHILRVCLTKVNNIPDLNKPHSFSSRLGELLGGVRRYQRKEFYYDT